MQSNNGGCGCQGQCNVPRREVLKWAGAAAALAAGGPAMAGPFSRADFEQLVPRDKRLSADWRRSLVARGEPAIYSGSDLKTIGMPVGGLCAGQLYLGGDGRLWHWDIFNEPIRTGAEHYARPMSSTSAVEQGFAVELTVDGAPQRRTLDAAGFADVRFRGEYPIGRVEYRQPGLPLEVTLEAFSPFVPLSAADSSLPLSVMEFRVANTGDKPVEGRLSGWLQNAVARRSGGAWNGRRRNRVVRRGGALILECDALAGQTAAVERPAEVFAAFEGDDYGAWTVEGEAFGRRPAAGAPSPQQKLQGFVGKGLVNSWPKSDRPRGRLVSPEFVIARPVVRFLIGGGNHAGRTCVNLLVDGRPVLAAVGQNSDRLEWVNWHVARWQGKKARIEIVDDHDGAWGHIDVDQIEFADRPRGAAARLEEEADFGSMALALLDAAEGDRGTANREATGADAAAAEVPLADRLVGAITKEFRLQAGEATTVRFVVAWHFANLQLAPVPTSRGRRYAERFASAAAAVEYLAANIARLSGQTRLWRDTWYDSTLPYWFLDRTIINASILASSTCHWFADGRFYGWEGVGCCPGTCTHVWHYAHSVARLFPELERDLRERTDFGLAFQDESGVIRFRGEGAGLAIDGQAGCILRTYREHQMSADDAFLRRVWPRVRRAIDCLIEQDGNGDGLLEGAQHNTLDADWYGPVAWLSGLYLAALAAGAAMAAELGDGDAAARLTLILEKGRRALVKRLFDGEYFINRPDATRPEAINSGTGCEIDQVFGQSWAFQVGLGRVLPADQTRRALAALWRYNFTPDVGPYREQYKEGRWYAMPGEAGLLMCTFPRTDWDFQRAKGDSQRLVFAGYFNECMTGFEHQVAGHMIWEGMVEEGLAVARAVHDRYHPARRNPFNEVECGDHYARAMASHGVYLAACGFEYHGPKGEIGFAPRVGAEDFRAAFTAAEGWGTFAQRAEAGRLTAGIELKYGRLPLTRLTLSAGKNPLATGAVAATVDGKPVAASLEREGERLRVQFAPALALTAGQSLRVDLK